jgi:SAM-dependent methyltransferase
MNSAHAPSAAQRVPFDVCPLCGGDRSTEVVTARCNDHPLYHPSLPPQISWLSCDACEHVFTDGYLAEPDLERMFDNAHANQLPSVRAGRAQLANERAVAARMIDKVVAVRGLPSGRWLDVGAGNGALLATAHEYGYDVIGLDRRRAVVDGLRELGFDARRCDLAELDDTELAVVSFADVLEHMPFPREALHHAHRRMADGAALFVSMPDRESFLWKRLDALGDNPYWAELEHVHNFGRRGLYRLLREEGFEPVRHGISERYVACMEVIAVRRPKDAA